MTRSTAASKSTMLMKSLAPRAAISAASFVTLAMSAPAKPGLSAARRSLKYSTGLSSLSLARWMRKMASRPVMSGRSMLIWRSNLHARRCARHSCGCRAGTAAAFLYFPQRLRLSCEEESLQELVLASMNLQQSLSDQEYIIPYPVQIIMLLPHVTTRVQHADSVYHRKYSFCRGG